MKTMKIIAIVVAMAICLPVSTFAATGTALGLPTVPGIIRTPSTPGITNITTPPATGVIPAAGSGTDSTIIAPDINAGQLNPNAVLGSGPISSMNMNISVDFNAKQVIVSVIDSKSSGPTDILNNDGFVYPEMTITIQRMAQGELLYTDLGTTQYKVSTYQPFGSPKTITEGRATFTDTNVKAGSTYTYRIKHEYQSKMYYTEPQTVSMPTEDYQMLKLYKAKRVDLYFSCLWKLAEGDVYKYEVQRSSGGSEFKTVAQVSLESPYISDIITNPGNGSYYYRIVATCTESKNPAKVGKSINSQPIEVKMGE